MSGFPTALEHEHSEAITLAAQWLAATPCHERGDRALVPLLRERFGLSPVEACEAIREGNLIQGGAL